jgi:hypothetical protein
MNDFSFKRNFVILTEILKKWMILTLCLTIIVVLSNGYYFLFEYGMSVVNTILSVFGCLLILVSFKVVFFLSFFRPFFGRDFDGSLLIFSVINSIIIVLALFSVSVVVNDYADDFPFADLKWILPVLAVIFAVMTLVGTSITQKMTKSI